MRREAFANRALEAAAQAHLAGAPLEGSLALLSVFVMAAIDRKSPPAPDPPAFGTMQRSDPTPVVTVNEGGGRSEVAEDREPVFAIERFPLSRCAAISASIDMRRDEKLDILSEHGLTIASWKHVLGHWTNAIRAATQGGHMAPLASYDDAYVEQLERERGRIDEETYVRISVAGERGAADDLAELRLPVPALLRIQRVWLRKMAEDERLARRVRQAMNG